MKAFIIILGLLVSFGSEAQNTEATAIPSTHVKEGKRVKVTHYHDNGAVRETGYFLNGTPDGQWETFDRNGMKTAELNYRDGKRHGEFRMWDSFADTYIELQYAEGALVNGNKWVKEAGFAASNKE